MNLACLIIWSILGAFAVYDLIKKNPVSPFSYFCAVLVCICNYLEKFLMELM